VFTGLRPGEKLREELMSELEATVPTAVQKIRVVRGQEHDAAGIAQGLARLARVLAVGSPDDLLRAIRDLVPESVPPLKVRRSGEVVSLSDLTLPEVEYGHATSVAEEVL
jgi:FlaA1/EpsC-like NDP-sugar epimerase